MNEEGRPGRMNQGIARPCAMCPAANCYFTKQNGCQVSDIIQDLKKTSSDPWPGRLVFSWGRWNAGVPLSEPPESRLFRTIFLFPVRGRSGTHPSDLISGTRTALCGAWNQLEGMKMGLTLLMEDAPVLEGPCWRQ